MMKFGHFIFGSSQGFKITRVSNIYILNLNGSKQFAKKHFGGQRIKRLSDSYLKTVHILLANFFIYKL